MTEPESTESESTVTGSSVYLPEQAAPVTASIVVQMSPLPGAGVTDLDSYAEGLTAYFARNISKFADPRGADVSVTVVCQQDGKTAGHQFKSGHYLKNDEEPKTP